MPLMGECVDLISLNLCLSSTIFVCQDTPTYLPMLERKKKKSKPQCEGIV
jgi:hypothetical protein